MMNKGTRLSESLPEHPGVIKKYKRSGSAVSENYLRSYCPKLSIQEAQKQFLSPGKSLNLKA